MFLKSLEIQGFKSFPDKTVLTFGKGITAVVGPNGSGKSNISDAIRWVLGEMSAKSLRGSRMEDVIFGGTVLRRPQGFAEVTLTIDNSGRELAFDGDEVAVTRRYYRSGESEYRLNRAEVRLRDIYELFLDTGLGRDGYSVIGQGRIAEIVAAKSEDRREIFEEASGIAKYRYRKEESERRLAAAEDNLSRLRDILTELESRVGPLREQAEKAKRYLTLAAEKKTLEVGLWLYTLDRQRGELREHENRLSLAKAQYDEMEEKLAAAASEIETAFLQAQEIAAKAEEFRRQAKTYEESAAACEAQAAVIQNDISHNEENISRLREEIHNVRSLGEEHETETARRRQELVGLEERRLSLAAELEACENGALELAGKGDAISAQMEEASAALAAINAELSKIDVDRSAAAATMEHIAGRLNAIDADTQARRARLETARQLSGEAESRIALSEEKAQELQNSLKGYELKANARRERLRAAEEKCRALSLKAGEKAQRAGMLEDLERHMEGFSNSVKAVMREHTRGMLEGIRGPVSRLMKTPVKVAVAIETALGAAAQNIVVDNEECAKAAISFLKNTNGGRATFLPLTSVRGNTLTQQGVQSCPGYVGLGSELVTYDAKYDGVMRSLLGRTVVAEDLDCAVAIARKYGYSFRIVTLDGQLVNAGGSMTGGSTGRAGGLLSRAGEIETLRKEAEKLKAELAAAEGEQKTAQAEAASLDASVTGIRGELATVQEDLIRLSGEKQRASEQIAALEQDLLSLEEEKARLSGQSEELGAAAHAASERSAQLELKAAAEQEKLESLGVGRDDITKKRGEQAERLTGLRLQTLGCEKDIEAARHDIEELERQMTDRAGRIEELNRQIAEFTRRNEEAGNSAQARKEQADALREQAADCVAQAEQTVLERQEVEKKSVELRSAERSLSDDREKISRELARLEERKTSAQADYDALIQRLWEEYELTRSEAEKTAERITDPAGAQKRLNSIKREIKELGDVNVGAVEEYREVSERYEFLKAQTEDVEQSKAELTELIESLTGKMREIFSEKFEEINRHFAHTFVELFGGGSAHLELTEPEDVLRSGIEIIVQPPGKIIKSLTALSGGEQAFVAIALYFAILKVRPSPFCVLDEIEAALDDANVARFAAYLRRMCDNTQFIVITHRRGTMDEADVLYGVTMQDEGVSKLLTLNVSELVERLGIRA